MSHPRPSWLPGSPNELPAVVQHSKIATRPVSPALQQKAKECVASFIKKARIKWGPSIDMPYLAFDLRGKTAGQAFWGKNLVRLNAILYIENAEDFLADTIPHEVAHLVTRKLYGAKVAPHGPEWQGVMREFGINPSRCHSYDVTNAAVGGVTNWTCDCGKVYGLGKKKSNQASKGWLTCRLCRAPLRLTGHPSPARPVKSELPVVPKPASIRQPHAVPAADREPTPPMIAYAKSLANKLGVLVPVDVLKSFSACAAFIEVSKKMTPALPTEKQMAFAEALAARKNIRIPLEALRSSALLSRWIGEQTKS